MESSTRSIFERIEEKLDGYFECKQRNTTVRMELFCGLVHFLSTLYFLPVIPSQMASLGCEKEKLISSIAITVALGSVFCGIYSNLPFIIAPPTSTSIYLVVAELNSRITRQQSNTTIIYSGIALLVVGMIKPVGRFVARVSSTLT